MQVTNQLSVSNDMFLQSSCITTCVEFSKSNADFCNYLAGLCMDHFPPIIGQEIKCNCLNAVCF